MAVSLKREFCSLAKPMAAFVAIPFAADIAFLSAFLLMLAIEGFYGGAAGAFAPAASSLFAGVYAPVCAGAVVFCPFAGFVYLLARFAREARASFESCAKRPLPDAFIPTASAGAAWLLLSMAAAGIATAIVPEMFLSMRPFPVDAADALMGAFLISGFVLDGLFAAVFVLRAFAAAFAALFACFAAIVCAMRRFRTSATRSAVSVLSCAGILAAVLLANEAAWLTSALLLPRVFAGAATSSAAIALFAVVLSLLLDAVVVLVAAAFARRPRAA